MEACRRLVILRKEWITNKNCADNPNVSSAHLYYFWYHCNYSSNSFLLLVKVNHSNQQHDPLSRIRWHYQISILQKYYYVPWFKFPVPKKSYPKLPYFRITGIRNSYFKSPLFVATISTTYGFHLLICRFILMC